MFNKKRIIFIGPLGNIEDKFLKQYDFVVRTNNFFSIDKELLKSERCDILVVNNLYVRCHHDKIIKNMNKIKYLLVKNKLAYDTIMKKIDIHNNDIYNRDNKVDKNKVIYMSYMYSKINFPFKKEPLLVSNFLFYLIQYFRPNLVYFTGFDFYQSKDVSKFWLPGYETKQSLRNNVLKGDKKNHNIESNILYFKYVLDQYRWIQCDHVLRDIIKKF